MQYMHANIPYMFDCWSDLVVHSLLPKSSIKRVRLLWCEREVQWPREDLCQRYVDYRRTSLQENESGRNMSVDLLLFVGCNLFQDQDFCTA